MKLLFCLITRSSVMILGLWRRYSIFYIFLCLLPSAKMQWAEKPDLGFHVEDQLVPIRFVTWLFCPSWTGSRWGGGMGIAEGTLWSESSVAVCLEEFFVKGIHYVIEWFNLKDMLKFQGISKDCWREIDHDTFRRRRILFYLWQIWG